MGTAGVAIGVRKAVREAAFTSRTRPVGFAPKAEQVSRQMGIKTSETDDESDGNAEIQRNVLAGELGCVPSQINYVITSRYTPEQG